MNKFSDPEKLKGADNSYKNLCLEDGKTVIIKYIPKNQKNVERIKEYEQLEYPFLVNILESFILEDKIVVVQEYVENGKLSELAGIIGQELTENYLRKILSGILYLHDNQIYLGTIALENILFTKDSIPKILLLKDVANNADRNVSPQDDMVAFAKVVFEFITGDVFENISDLDEDLRIIPEIKQYLLKILDPKEEEIPTIENLKESDKYIRSLLGIEDEVLEELIETNDTTTPDTPLSFPELNKELLMDSMKQEKLLGKSESREFSSSVNSIDEIFLLNTKGTLMQRDSLDDDESSFSTTASQIRIQPITAQAPNNNGTEIFDFSDDNNELLDNVNTDVILQVNTLHSELSQNSKNQQFCGDDDADDAEGYSKIENGCDLKPIPVELIEKSDKNDDSDDNFGEDDEIADFNCGSNAKNFGSLIKPRTISSSEQLRETPIACFNSGSSKLKESDDIADEIFDDDDADTNFFTNVIVEQQSNTNFMQVDFYDDEQIESSLNFDDDELLESIINYKLNSKSINEQLENLRELCNILYIRRCHKNEEYSDKSIFTIIEKSELDNFIIHNLNEMYKIQSNEIILYFIRLITLLMQLSAQLVFIITFYENIFSIINLPIENCNVDKIDICQYYQNEEFDELEEGQKIIITECNFTNTIISYLLMDFNEKPLVLLQEEIFDLFCKQDDISIIYKYIVCYRFKKIDKSFIKLSKFGIDLFEMLCKKYFEFKIDMFEKLEGNQDTELIIEELLFIVTEYDIKLEANLSIISQNFDFINEILENVNSVKCEIVIEELRNLPDYYLENEQIEYYISQLLLTMSKIFDDELENLLFKNFSEWMISICNNYANNIRSTENILITLLNIVFSSDSRRKLLAEESFLLILVNIISTNEEIKNIAISLLLELLKVEIEIQNKELLISLSEICLDSLASQPFSILASTLLNKWQTINMQELHKQIINLQKANFEQIPSATILMLSKLMPESRLLQQSIFNKSMEIRCYNALAEENSIVSAALRIILLCSKMIKPSLLKNYKNAIDELTCSNNQSIKNTAKQILIEFSCLAEITSTIDFPQHFLNYYEQRIQSEKDLPKYFNKYIANEIVDISAFPENIFMMLSFQLQYYMDSEGLALSDYEDKLELLNDRQVAFALEISEKLEMPQFADLSAKELATRISKMSEEDLDYIFGKQEQPTEDMRRIQMSYNQQDLE